MPYFLKNSANTRVKYVNVPVSVTALVRRGGGLISSLGLLSPPPPPLPTVATTRVPTVHSSQGLLRADQVVHAFQNRALAPPAAPQGLLARDGRRRVTTASSVELCGSQARGSYLIWMTLPKKGRCQPDFEIGGSWEVYLYMSFLPIRAAKPFRG